MNGRLKHMDLRSRENGADFSASDDGRGQEYRSNPVSAFPAWDSGFPKHS